MKKETETQTPKAEGQKPESPKRKIKLPLLSNRKVLRDSLGVQYSDAHLARLEKPGKSEDAYGGDDPFPKRQPLSTGRRPRVAWPTWKVLDWLKRRGFEFDDIEFVIG